MALPHLFGSEYIRDQLRKAVMYGVGSHELIYCVSYRFHCLAHGLRFQSMMSGKA